MLQTKQVGNYTVSQAGMREAVRRMTMIKKIQEMVQGGELDDDTVTALSIYPHIAGCVTPIISVNAFLEIPEQELDELSKVAMELNPHWYEIPDQEKKTDAILIESTPS